MFIERITNSVQATFDYSAFNNLCNNWKSREHKNKELKHENTKNNTLVESRPRTYIRKQLLLLLHLLM